MPTKVGDRLRIIREQRGLTQAEFAELVGTSRKTQVRYEAGERQPDTDYLTRLDEHGFDVFFVLTGHNDANRREPITPTEALQRVMAAMEATSTLREMNGESIKLLTGVAHHLKATVPEICDMIRARDLTNSAQ